jgi:hypothetical protein
VPRYQRSLLAALDDPPEDIDDEQLLDFALLWAMDAPALSYGRASALSWPQTPLCKARFRTSTTLCTCVSQ